MCGSERATKMIFNILRGREILIVCMMNREGESVCERMGDMKVI